jgi:hypothetical protein
MEKVFIIQHPKPRAKDGWQPDLSPAANYGQLRFVFDADDKIYADPATAMKKAVERLKEFDAETDFLCWTNFADPAGLWLVIQLLAAGGCKKLRYLYWSRGKRAGGMTNDAGYYFPVEIDVAMALSGNSFLSEQITKR